jgi:holliday junction resolvase YEN1
MIFFRLIKFLKMPILPLFVFDGPKRPATKRGKRIGGKDHWMIQGVQEMMTAFGFEWRRVCMFSLYTSALSRQ